MVNNILSRKVMVIHLITKNIKKISLYRMSFYSEPNVIVE